MGEIKRIKGKFIPKYETKEDWERSEYIPEKGEIVESFITEGNSVVPYIKIGDGKTTVKELPYSTKNTKQIEADIREIKTNIQDINTELSDNIEVDIREIQTNIQDINTELSGKLNLPSSAPSLATVPVIRKNTRDEYDYIAVSNGVSSDIIVRRTVEDQDVGGGVTVPGGNIAAPTVDKIPDNGDVYASVSKVKNMMEPIVEYVGGMMGATISGIELSSGQTKTDAIKKGEYGAFFIKGDDLEITYSCNATSGTNTATGQMHFIWIYKMPGYDRLVHYAYSSGSSILGAKFTPYDFTLKGDISVKANGGGTRIVKMLMKSE